MKKIIFTVILMWSAVMTVNAQAPTTLEEYTYVIVGYKLQLNMKLEMKKGYSLKDIDNYEEEDRRIEFKALTRNGEKSPCAVMMIYYLPHGEAPQYYCIPSYNAPSDTWDKYYASINFGEDNPQQRLKFFALSISKIMMKLNMETK